MGNSISEHIYGRQGERRFSLAAQARERSYAAMAALRRCSQWMMEPENRDTTIEWECVLPDPIFEEFDMMDESRGIYLEQGEAAVDSEGRACHVCRALGSPLYFHRGLIVLSQAMDGMARSGMFGGGIVDVRARAAWTDDEPVPFVVGCRGHAEAWPKDGESAEEAHDRACRQVLAMGERDELADARLVDSVLGVSEDDHFSAVRALARRKAPRPGM